MRNSSVRWRLRRARTLLSSVFRLSATLCTSSAGSAANSWSCDSPWSQHSASATAARVRRACRRARLLVLLAHGKHRLLDAVRGDDAASRARGERPGRPARSRHLCAVVARALSRTARSDKAKRGLQHGSRV